MLSLLLRATSCVYQTADHFNVFVCLFPLKMYCVFAQGAHITAKFELCPMDSLVFLSTLD